MAIFYLEARITNRIPEVEIRISGPLKSRIKLVVWNMWSLERLVANFVTNFELKMITLHIQRLCITGLRREIPRYPQKRKNENFISTNSLTNNAHRLKYKAESPTYTKVKSKQKNHIFNIYEHDSSEKYTSHWFQELTEG